MRYEFSESLDNKVRQSILLIRHAYRHATWRGKCLEVAISGGKDSDVMIQLCRMADVWGKDGLRPVHRCTTIDPPHTLRHVGEQGVEILRPKHDFRWVIEHEGVPNRFHRHCCGYLKEFVVEDYVLVGVRKSESVKRAKNYLEPSACKTYQRGGTCEQFYQILEWTGADVEEFVRVTGIKCHPLYYDEDGVFHVERRLGCIGCTLMYRKKRIEDFRKYPKMLRLYCRHGQRYLDKYPHKHFRDVYEMMACDLFYKDIHCFEEAGLQPGEAKSRLEEYFNLSLDL